MIAEQARLAAARIARQSAHHRFHGHLQQIRDDVAARGIGTRVADRVSERAHAAASGAKDIAQDNPGIVAGTLAALAAWLLRRPFLALGRKLFGRGTRTDDHEEGELE